MRKSSRNSCFSCPESWLRTRGLGWKWDARKRREERRADWARADRFYASRANGERSRAVVEMQKRKREEER
jgi:hypothetical protein